MVSFAAPCECPYASSFHTLHQPLSLSTNPNPSGCRYSIPRSCSNFVFMMIRVIILDSHLVRVRSRPPPRMPSLAEGSFTAFCSASKSYTQPTHKTNPNGKGRLPTDSSMEPMAKLRMPAISSLDLSPPKKSCLSVLFLPMLWLNTNQNRKINSYFFQLKRSTEK